MAWFIREHLLIAVNCASLYLPSSPKYISRIRDFRSRIDIISGGKKGKKERKNPRTLWNESRVKITWSNPSRCKASVLYKKKRKIQPIVKRVDYPPRIDIFSNRLPSFSREPLPCRERSIDFHRDRNSENCIFRGWKNTSYPLRERRELRSKGDEIEGNS